MCGKDRVPRSGEAGGRGWEWQRPPPAGDGASWLVQAAGTIEATRVGNNLNGSLEMKREVCSESK